MEDGTGEYSAPDMETERQVCRKSFGKCTLARKISKKGKSESFHEKHNSNSL